MRTTANLAGDAGAAAGRENLHRVALWVEAPLCVKSRAAQLVSRLVSALLIWLGLGIAQAQNPFPTLSDLIPASEYAALASLPVPAINGRVWPDDYWNGRVHYYSTVGYANDIFNWSWWWLAYPSDYWDWAIYMSDYIGPGVVDVGLAGQIYLRIDGVVWSSSHDSWTDIISKGHVTQLRLNNVELSGAIPASLGSLSALELLDLSRNSLSGPIPANLGNLGALFYLNLSSNSLSGPIPANLGNLGALQYLYLSDNSLSGIVPDFSSLPSLWWFGFQYNWLDLKERSAAWDNIDNMWSAGVWVNALPQNCQMTLLRVQLPQADVHDTDGIDTPIVPVTDTSALAKAAPLGKGVAADGVTPVLLEVDAVPGEYEIRLFADADYEGGTLKGHVYCLEGGGWVRTTKLTIAAIGDAKLGTNFVYLEGLDWEKFSRSPHVNVLDVHAFIDLLKLDPVPGMLDNTVYSVDFSIVHTPVALIHGYNADSSTWSEDFMPALQYGYRTDGTIGLVNYGTSYNNYINLWGSLKPLAALLDVTLRQGFEREMGKDLAFTRYDVVAHSQGGVLTRMLCQTSSGGAPRFASDAPVSDKNMYRGRFRRVISLGAPQNGSLIAWFAGKLRTSPSQLGSDVMESLVDTFNPLKFDPWGSQIVTANDPRFPVDPRIRFHCLAATIANAQPPGYGNCPLSYWALSLCELHRGGPLTRGQMLLPSGSDGIVDFTSERTESANHGSTAVGNIAHSHIPLLFNDYKGASETSSKVTGDMVARLLEHGDDDFGAFKLPVLLSDTARQGYEALVPRKSDYQPTITPIFPILPISGPRPKALLGYSYFLQIPPELPAGGTVKWDVLVFRTNGISMDSAAAQVDPSDSRQVTVMVDDQIPADVVLFGSYSLTNGDVAVSEPLLVSSIPAHSSLTAITATPTALLGSVGDEVPVKVWGVFAGGLRRMLYIPTGQATYHSSDPAVASVDSTGWTTVRGFGKATISVSYRGLTAQVPVSTIPPTAGRLALSTGTNGIREITYIGEAGTANVIEASTDLVTWVALATVYNSDGVIHFQDSATLPRRFYRVRLVGVPVAGLAPVMLADPQSAAVSFGAGAVIWGFAAGPEPMSYRWLFNGTNLPGATGPTLNLASVQGANLGSYCLVASNAYGCVTSSVAVLTMPPTITAQPVSAASVIGFNATFTVAATGSSPITYQWLKNGAVMVNSGNKSGVATATLTVANVQTNDVGSYSVVVTNALGSVTSAVAALTVTVDLLGPALDGPGLVWNTGGSAPWFNQTATTHDSADAAQSGFIANRQESWMETALAGPGTLTYWWRVDSEFDYDYLEFYLDGVLQSGRISGAVDWQKQTNRIPAGAHTAKWRYSKDVSYSSGQDAGWVDDVHFVPDGPFPEIFAQPVSRINFAGTTAPFTVAAAGTPPLAYQWRRNSTNLSSGATISGAQTDSLILSAVTTNDTASYTVLVSNSFGSVTSAVAALTVSVNMLAPALDGPGLVWNSGGSAFWFNQTATTHDGVDAAQSGSITDGQESWIETTLAGPGMLTFWWRVDSEDGYYYFYLDGRAQLKSDGLYGTWGTVDWQKQTNRIPAGAHTARWSYKQYEGAASGQEACWVDDVHFVPDAPFPEFIIQPVSRTNAVGATASFVVAATGSAPLTYQWRRNGTNLSNGNKVVGILTNVLSLLSLTTNDSASYSVVISNSFGSVTSQVAVLTVLPVPSLAESLNATDLLWTTGGSANWQPQLNVTHQGVWAARSGFLANSHESWLQTSLVGPGTLSFWWKVDSEYSHDYLEFYLDDVLSDRIAGAVDWQEKSVSIVAGTHAVKWRYMKNASGSSGQDAGWVDEVRFIPYSPAPKITYQPRDSTNFVGTMTLFSVYATGDAPLGYQWRRNGTNLVSGTNNYLQLWSLTANDAAGYSVIVSNSFGSVTSQVAVLTVLPIPSLAEALDATNLVWTTGGDAPWRPEVDVTFDDVDAAQSGLITNNQESWLQTTLIGPGTLTFRWQVSSEYNHDFLEFYLDGVIQQRTSGNTSWFSAVNGCTNYIPAGAHIAKWRYMKDASGSDNDDFANVDNVHFVPGGSSPKILAQPVSRINFVGTTASFSVAAAGTPPFAYQWRRNGTNLLSGATISGAQTDSLILSAVTTNDTASYTVLVSNSFGSVTSAVAALTVIVNMLAPALDGPGLVWNSGGGAFWFNQTATTHDGVDAAQSGSITDGQESWIETTLAGPGMLTFWWRVDSEYNYDYLEVYLDGVLQSGRISGTVDWQQKANRIPAGAHTAKWRYSKSLWNSSGQDAGWVDDVHFVPDAPLPEIVIQPGSRTNFVGTTASFTVAAAGTAPLAYQWRRNGTNLVSAPNFAGELSDTLYLWQLTTNDAAGYSVVVSNSFGSVTSQVAALTVLAMPSLAEALNATDLVWTTGGNANWQPEIYTTHDGVTAVTSGIIADSQESWLQTSLVGPGTLTFWWRVDSESNYDYLKFYLDGVLQSGGISGNVDWQKQTNHIPAGAHTAKWRYSKDESDSSGQDAGWVDDVKYYTTAPLQLEPANGSLSISNGVFNLRLTGAAGTIAVLERSFGLSTWTPFQTNTLPASGMLLSIPTGTNRQQFYRARQTTLSP